MEFSVNRLCPQGKDGTPGEPGSPGLQGIKVKNLYITTLLNSHSKNTNFYLDLINYKIHLIKLMSTPDLQGC